MISDATSAGMRASDFNVAPETDSMMMRAVGTALRMA